MIFLECNTEPIITAIYTLTGGIVLYLLSKFLELYIIEPQKQFIQFKSKVKESLVFHANKFGNKDDWENRPDDFYKAFEEIRVLASQCFSFASIYFLARFFKLIPSSKRLNEAGSILIRLSNSVKAHDEDFFLRLEGDKNKLNKILKL